MIGAAAGGEPAVVFCLSQLKVPETVVRSIKGNTIVINWRLT